MHYIEIGQDIVNAIKGGADYSGKDESEEIVGYIDDFRDSFAPIIEMIVKLVKDVYNALKSRF